MRILKDNKHKAILYAARNEFIRKGFKDASMRNIARGANVGLSNIYNYFKNKDEIFVAVVKPAKDDLYSFIKQQHTEKNIDFNLISAFGYQDEMIENYIYLIDIYKEELRLLLFHSEGSSLRDFREAFIDYITRVNIDHMNIVKKHYPHARYMSDFFIRTLSSWMVASLGEIVTHKLGRHKIREFFKECFQFEIAGWREIIGV